MSSLTFDALWKDDIRYYPPYVSNIQTHKLFDPPTITQLVKYADFCPKIWFLKWLKIV